MTGGFACNRKAQCPYSTSTIRKNAFRGGGFQNQNWGTDLQKNIRRVIQDLSPLTSQLTLLLLSNEIDKDDPGSREV